MCTFICAANDVSGTLEFLIKMYEALNENKTSTNTIQSTANRFPRMEILCDGLQDIKCFCLYVFRNPLFVRTNSP